MMEPTVISLDELIAPLSSEEFFDRYWEREVLHVTHDDPEFYSRIFSLGDVDRWLVNAADSPADRALIKSSEGSGRPSKRCRPGEISLEEAYEAILAGDSLVLEDLGTGWPALQPTLRGLGDRFGAKILGNLYFTPAGSQTFPRHIDDHDVFVFQLYGSKRWHIFPMDDGYLPIHGMEYEYQLSFPKRDIDDDSEQIIDLQQGEFLYVPRGIPHRVVATDETSLHLTVAIFAPHVLDLVRAALEDFCLRDQRLQRTLPPDYASDPDALAQLSESFADIVQTFAREASFDAACHAIRTSKIERQPYPGDGHFAQLLSLDRLSPDAVLERRLGLDCLVETTDEHATIRFGSRQMRGPAALRHAFERIRDQRRFRLSELPALSDKSRLVLGKRLIRDGLLRVVTDGDSG